MTKRMLKDSLLELMEDCPVGKITIKNICDNADVNRTTFYVYYESVERLLADIENDVFEQIPVSEHVPTIDSYDEFLDMLTSFFEYVRGNERLFKVLIFKTDNNAFCNRLMAAIAEKYGDQFYRNDSTLDRCEFIYCINGVIGLLKYWIERGFPFSGRKLAALALKMSIQATELDHNALQDG